MKKLLLISILSFLIVRCKDIGNKAKIEKEKIETNTHVSKKRNWHDRCFEHSLEALNLKKLDTLTTNEKLIRFIYRGSFEPYNQYYEVNLIDLRLIRKYFLMKEFDDSEFNEIISTDTFKLSPKEIKTINLLEERSMIWSLEKNAHSAHLDCAWYVYEATRPIIGYEVDEKTYCLVIRHCPQNFDFRNLGEYLKSITQVTNSYKKF